MAENRLNAPNRAKLTTTAENSDWLVVTSSQQGWRMDMEDENLVKLDFNGDPRAALFAVFDGHSGSKVSEFAAEHFERHLTKSLAAFDVKDDPMAPLLDVVCPKTTKTSPISTETMIVALQNTFKSLDAEIGHRLERPQAGSTALCVLVKDGQLFCANAGDSRAVACVNGRPVALSSDHKPNDVREKPRIEAAGGKVRHQRVQGRLAMSRALGDFDLKDNRLLPTERQMVSPMPDIVRHDLDGDVEFVVIACDGIWDACTNRQSVEFVRSKIATLHRPQLIVEELLDKLVAKSKSDIIGSHDNMTCILACHLNGRSYAEFIMRCRRPLHHVQ